jgi:ABC-type multidrug transport system fused ATPase/permease subunit
MSTYANRSEHKEQLKRIEYQEVSKDWRHRDTMLWQALAVAVAATAAIFGVAFRAETGWLLRVALVFLALALDLLLLLKITKDHHYQIGSIDLLERLGGDARASILKDMGTQYGGKNTRIFAPSTAAEKKYDRSLGLRCGSKWLTKQSTFLWFYWVMLIITATTAVALVVSVLLAASHMQQSDNGCKARDVNRGGDLVFHLARFQPATAKRILGVILSEAEGPYYSASSVLSSPTPDGPGSGWQGSSAHL